MLVRGSIKQTESEKVHLPSLINSDLNLPAFTCLCDNFGDWQLGRSRQIHFLVLYYWNIVVWLDGISLARIAKKKKCFDSYPAVIFGSVQRRRHSTELLTNICVALSFDSPTIEYNHRCSTCSHLVWWEAENVRRSSAINHVFIVR